MLIAWVTVRRNGRAEGDHAPRKIFEEIAVRSLTYDTRAVSLRITLDIGLLQQPTYERRVSSLVRTSL